MFPNTPRKEMKLMFETVILKQSRCFKRLSYNAETETLYVTFRQTNRTYGYKASRELFLAFIESSSKGRFFNQFIKPFATQLSQRNIVSHK